MVCGCSKNAESCGCSTMNAENDIHTDLIISIDTSASTGYLNVNQKYRKVAMKSIKDLNPTNVIIFDHNGTVEKVFEGSADDGFAFLRMDSDTLQPRNGTARMDDVLNAIMGLRGNKLILTDLTETRKNAEEPTVQEPDFLPNGDGRIIGQQDFAMNLTPLHAESENTECDACQKDKPIVAHVEFDGPFLSALCKECYAEHLEMGGKPNVYGAESFNADVEDKFTSSLDCRNIVRPIIGKGGGEDRLYSLSDLRQIIAALKEEVNIRMEDVWDAEDSPSPNFNEGITGQDGPSASPTNQTFEAMRTMAPSSSDVNSARRMLKNQGYGEVIYDRYLVNQQGSSNKFYYTAITEKDGKYFPMGAYGRIGYLARLFNVAGKTERPTASFGTMEQAYRHLREKEQSKVNARKSEKQYIDYTLKSAETLAEIEGPTAEATAGGLHSPSSFDMTWEDGSGQSSASIPPNEIAWAENTGFPTWAKLGAGIAVLYGVGKVITSKMSEQKAENTLLPAVKARKGCCGGKSAETVRKNSEYSVGQINPVEVEGQSDVHGAEEVQLSKPHQGPQSTHYSNERPSQKMW